MAIGGKDTLLKRVSMAGHHSSNLFQKRRNSPDTVVAAADNFQVNQEPVTLSNSYKCHPWQ